MPPATTVHNHFYTTANHTLPPTASACLHAPLDCSSHRLPAYWCSSCQVRASSLCAQMGLPDVRALFASPPQLVACGMVPSYAPAPLPAACLVTPSLYAGCSPCAATPSLVARADACPSTCVSAPPVCRNDNAVVPR